MGRSFPEGPSWGRGQGHQSAVCMVTSSRSNVQGWGGGPLPSSSAHSGLPTTSFTDCTLRNIAVSLNIPTIQKASLISLFCLILIKYT